jgi:hypothetical protein
MSSSKKIDLKRTLRQVFIRFIDWIYSQSFWYFRPGLELLRLSLSHWFNSPLPCVNEFIAYTYTKCKGGGGWYGGLGLRHLNTCRKVPLQTTFRIAFYESYLSTIIGFVYLFL